MSLQTYKPYLHDLLLYFLYHLPQLQNQYIQPWLLYKLRPNENLLLDLQSKIDKSKHIDWTIELVPSYSRKISTENSEQIARIKENFIIFDILNRDFNNNFTIKKYQELGYIFLNNQKSLEKIITEYYLI